MVTVKDIKNWLSSFDSCERATLNIVGQKIVIAQDNEIVEALDLNTGEIIYKVKRDEQSNLDRELR